MGKTTINTPSVPQSDSSDLSVQWQLAVGNLQLAVGNFSASKGNAIKKDSHPQYQRWPQNQHWPEQLKVSSSLRLYVCLFICPSVRLSVCSSVCLSERAANLFVDPWAMQSIFRLPDQLTDPALPFCHAPCKLQSLPAAYLSVCLSVCLSLRRVGLFVRFLLEINLLSRNFYVRLRKTTK